MRVVDIIFERGPNCQLRYKMKLINVTTVKGPRIHHFGLCY